MDDGPALRLAAGVLDETIDAVTFTSAPAVRNFFLILQQHDLVGAVRSRFADGVAFVTVGPVCSEEARAWGVERPVEPGRARMGSMIRALCDSLAVRRRDLVIGGVPVVLQGTALAIDGGDLVHLTDRERALFRVMLDRSGQVVPRAILMRQVWGVGQADPHTLEVTVARLRRRLGDAGTGLKTVPRRGYLLDVSA